MVPRFTDRAAIVVGGGLSCPGTDPAPGAPDVLPIGHVIALTLARQGARVAVVDRDPDAAKRTVTAVEDLGGEACVVVADATDAADVDRAVVQVVRRWQRLDIVCNNVGSARLADLGSLSPEDWRTALAINLDSVFLSARATLPHLIERGGAIVNVSSLASIRWTGYAYPAYAAAKAGVNQLTVSLAAQYAPQHVRVNAVLAGLIDTPLVYRDLTDGADPSAVRASRDARSPTGRSGTAQDVADAVAFLASDEASYVSGVLLPVDGGLHVRAGQVAGP